MEADRIQLNGKTCVWLVRGPGLHTQHCKTKQDGSHCFQVRGAAMAALHLLQQTVSNNPHLNDQLQIVHVPLLRLNQLVNIALSLPLHGLHSVQGLEIGTPCRDKVAELRRTPESPHRKWTFLSSCAGPTNATRKGHFQRVSAICRELVGQLRLFGAPGSVLLEVNLAHL